MRPIRYTEFYFGDPVLLKELTINFVNGHGQSSDLT
jgi:hypothetical protein